MNKREELENKLRDLYERSKCTMDMFARKKLNDEYMGVEHELRNLPKEPANLGEITLTRESIYKFPDGSKFSIGPQGLAYINGKTFKVTVDKQGIPLKAEGEVLDDLSQSMAPVIYTIKIVDEPKKKLEVPVEQLRQFSRSDGGPDLGLGLPVLPAGGWRCSLGHCNFKERLQCVKCSEARDEEAAKNLGIAPPPKRKEKK
jgi:hypothetical protein